MNISNKDKLKSIVNDIVANSDSWEEGSIEQKIADLYDTYMDVENRNNQGRTDIAICKEIVRGRKR